MEIYLERIRDLLARRYLLIRDSVHSASYAFHECSSERQPSGARGEIQGCVRQELVRLLRQQCSGGLRDHRVRLSILGSPQTSAKYHQPC